ncbi:M10 family metallopeptidase C-terminal domain-containing protein [Microvirga sp. ACRRW]|uniref:M10 family metallopeptidase n=1 Tax=Microvirga sp. ACRRW TaxID=2918205 RepID=UPI001EF4259D|nr:M10 family metallopeptidase [Microvirga sp. ACRRW]MCG7394888.1 M10 family metallopeptidase C-terminal domain-containing protein [Microvirga sp. ACRRW]
MAATISVARTGNQNIDGILSGSRWDSPNLTYSFPKNASYYDSNYSLWNEPQYNFGALNSTQSQAAREVFAMIASVSNLTFTGMTESSSSHATIRLAVSDRASPAWSYYPDPTETGGDIWFGRTNGWFDEPVPGSYGYYGFIHEILHSVGLKHGNETTVFGAMPASRDSMEFSAMTYRSYVGADGQYVENEAWGYVQTPMMYDIAALQQMYGADYTTNSGNTVYRWNPGTGQQFVNGVGQTAPGGNRIFGTVWDGGGIDTYDLSNYATNLNVDLRPGEWSRFSTKQIAMLGEGHYARGNIANALTYQGDPRSLIENAVGGSGSDAITGNIIANDLRGGGGNDRLYGREGNDMLTGGAGNDAFYFNTKPNRTSNFDQITDFSVANDTIYLDRSVYTTLKTGQLSSAAFWIGSRAHDTTDRIIYDSAKGGLHYDADGNGNAASVQIAQLTKGLKLTTADFMVA